MLLELRDGNLLGVDVGSEITEDGCPTCGWGSLECTDITFNFDNGVRLTLTRESRLASDMLEVCVSFEELVRAFTKVTGGYTWFEGTCAEFVKRMDEELKTSMTALG